MKRTVMVIALILGLSPCLAQAIAPESGMYWNPRFSGRAFYIEHQEGRVGVAIYAFNRETGAPEIYVSGGLLRDDGPILRYSFDPPLPQEGLVPMTCPHS